jgi:prevent-host-death family protein
MNARELIARAPHALANIVTTSVSDLRQNPGEVIADAKKGVVTLITKGGKPIAAIVDPAWATLISRLEDGTLPAQAIEALLNERGAPGGDNPLRARADKFRNWANNL